MEELFAMFENTRATGILGALNAPRMTISVKSSDDDVVSAVSVLCCTAASRIVREPRPCAQQAREQGRNKIVARPRGVHNASKVGAVPLSRTCPLQCGGTTGTSSVKDMAWRVAEQTCGTESRCCESVASVQPVN